MDKKKLVEFYINEYHPNCKQNADYWKCETNKVKQLINKILKDKTYKDFPFDLMPIEEQSKLLYHLLEQSSEREIVSNMGKTDVNRDFSDFILHNQESELIYKDLENKPLNIKEGTKINRGIIRSMDYNSSLVLKDLLENNEDIRRAIVNECSLYFMLGLVYENYNFIKDYIEYVSDGLLQFVNYRVIYSTEINDKEKLLESIVQKIDELTDLIDIQIQRKRKEQIEDEVLRAEELSRFFAFYREEQSYYEEYIAILRVLKEEVDNDASRDLNKKVFEPLEKEYIAKKVLLSDIEIDKLEYVITEGKQIYDYRNKLAETKKIIDIFREYGGRDCYSNCLQDIKVYFRETFISKQGYRSKKAISIARDYLSACEGTGIALFENQAHYMFYREKISRGYFREKGLLQVYFLKTRLQEKLYSLLLKTYLFYDYNTTISFVYEINNHMLKRVSELLA